MKRLFIVTFCLAMGAGAFAADSKTVQPAGKKVEVKAAAETGIVVSTREQKDAKFRIQRAIMTQDLCGNHIIVYVSGPHGTTWLQMYDVALDYVVDHMDSNGCYVG